jgi:hypothetical protein
VKSKSGGCSAQGGDEPNLLQSERPLVYKGATREGKMKNLGFIIRFPGYWSNRHE